MIEIKELVKYPVKYDGMTYIFDANGNMILMIRGFGRLSNKFPETAEEVQDDIGYFVAEAINEKLLQSRRRKTPPKLKCSYCDNVEERKNRNSKPSCANCKKERKRKRSVLYYLERKQKKLEIKEK